MNLNFQGAIDDMGGANATWRLANAARPAANYLLATLLPEMNKPTYHVESGTMTVRPTMAGLVGMDSPYPPSGVVQLGTFLEQSAKIANDTTLSEKSLREIQMLVATMSMNGEGADIPRVLGAEVLNFYEKVVIQANLDTAEWLRGQALGTGAIAWTFNGINLTVDYGVPSANKFTARTIGANTAYSGSSSAFWTDVKAAQRKLRFRVRAILLGTDLLSDIISNSVNNIEVAAQNGNMFTLQRLVSRGGNTVRSTEAQERITVITYDEEGEILDPANPGQTIKVPFLPPTKMVFIGDATNDGYRVGQGATDDPTNTLALGYTHIAPTVEGGGRAGRWGRVYTPENRPWQVVGQAVANILPVIESPQKLAIATSELSA